MGFITRNCSNYPELMSSTWPSLTCEGNGIHIPMHSMGIFFSRSKRSKSQWTLSIAEWSGCYQVVHIRQERRLASRLMALCPFAWLVETVVISWWQSIDLGTLVDTLIFWSFPPIGKRTVGFSLPNFTTKHRGRWNFTRIRGKRERNVDNVRGFKGAPQRHPPQEIRPY